MPDQASPPPDKQVRRQLSLESRKNARRRAMDLSYRTLKSEGTAGPMSLYAWYYLSDEERAAYATWKESPVSGAQYVGGGSARAPANWLLLDRGSVRGVADRDVGYVGIGYLAAAVEHMKAGGITKAWETWAATRGNRSAQEARVT